MAIQRGTIAENIFSYSDTDAIIHAVLSTISFVKVTQTYITEHLNNILGYHEDCVKWGCGLAEKYNLKMARVAILSSLRQNTAACLKLAPVTCHTTQPISDNAAVIMQGQIFQTDFPSRTLRLSVCITRHS